MKRFQHMTEEERELAARFYKQGMSIREISKRLRWSFGAVQLALHENPDVEVRPQGGSRAGRLVPPQDKLDRIVELYQQGYSVETIGREVGIAHNTVTRWLERVGVPIRTRWETAHYSRLEAISRDGKNALGIAQRHVLEVLEDAAPAHLRTRDITTKLTGKHHRSAVRNALLDLESHGLVISFRRSDSYHRTWWRSDLAFSDVLWHGVMRTKHRGGNQPPGEMMPIEPFRDWLKGLVERARHEVRFDHVTDMETASGVQLVADKLHTNEKRIRVLLGMSEGEQQDRISLALADRMLTDANANSNSQVELEDLWPELIERWGLNTLEVA